MTLSDDIFEEAVKRMSNQTVAKELLVYPKYLRAALQLIGKLKQPVKRVSGLRKRKRALYWRGIKGEV